MVENDCSLNNKTFFIKGLKDALPLLGGYIPVAISFGIIATQANFSPLEATLISLFIYAGASQFLLVAMVASGASLWLAVLMTLLVNARHVVYAPNLALFIPNKRVWWLLMYGLTDQIYALAHTRLPNVPEQYRSIWFTSASLLAWVSWVVGTAIGAVVGEEVTQTWPTLAQVMPFALPALFIVLLAPKFTSRMWSYTLGVSIVIALIFSLSGMKNIAIPIAALCGAFCYFLLDKLAQGALNNDV